MHRAASRCGLLILMAAATSTLYACASQGHRTRATSHVPASKPAVRVFSLRDAFAASKHGVDLAVYPIKPDSEGRAGIVFVETDHGHQQEFVHLESTFIYYIIEGNGVFVVDGAQHRVKATDVIVIPPKHRIYYAGELKMILVTTPAWSADNEREVRRLTPDDLKGILSGRKPR